MCLTCIVFLKKNWYLQIGVTLHDALSEARDGDGRVSGHAP